MEVAFSVKRTRSWREVNPRDFRGRTQDAVDKPGDGHEAMIVRYYMVLHYTYVIWETRNPVPLIGQIFSTPGELLELQQGSVRSGGWNTEHGTDSIPR